MREVLEQIRDSGAPFPVNLDDVWQACGFHTKATANQGLKRLDKAEVILDAPTPRKAGQTGRPPKVTLMTLAAFEDLCTKKPAGAEVWNQYKELCATPRGPASPAAPAGPTPVPALVPVLAASTPAVFDDSRRLEIKKLYDAASSSTESRPPPTLPRCTCEGCVRDEVDPDPHPYDPVARRAELRRRYRFHDNHRAERGIGTPRDPGGRPQGYRKRRPRRPKPKGGPATSAAPAGPAPVPALVPVLAASTPSVFDDSRRLEIKAMFDAVSNATESHPINFDNVWRICGYARKDNAKKALWRLELGDEVSLRQTAEPNKFTPHNKEIIFLTVRAFKHFCMKAPGAFGAQVCDYYISLEQVANAAIAVAQDVASGEVTVTATSSGGLKRLRTLEDAINSNAKRVKSFTSEQTVSHSAALDYEKVIRDVQMKFASEMEAIEEERKEKVENALAVRRNHEFYYGSLAKKRREAAYAAQEELKREQQRYSANLAELEELKQQMASSDANFKKVKAELEVEMRDKLNVWLRVQELDGVVFSEDMVAAL